MDSNKTGHKNDLIKNSITKKSRHGRMLALFAFVALMATVTFSATTSMSKLDKFIQNNIPSSVISGWNTFSHSASRTYSSIRATVIDEPTVTTDKADYLPGETVIITGSGFGGDHQVTLQVLHVDNTVESGEGHEPWTVGVDANGSFNSTWEVRPDAYGKAFILKAIGVPSGKTAEARFTDGFEAKLLGKCKDATISGCTSRQNRFPNENNGDNWIDGNLKGWSELDSIPTRVLLKASGQDVGFQKTITVNFDHSKLTNDGITLGIDNLLFANYTKTGNVQVAAEPVLSAPSDQGTWSYTFVVVMTNEEVGYIEFGTRLSAGARNFNGSSLSLGGSPSLGNLQISKPVAKPGKPDLFVNKSAPASSQSGGTIHYTIQYGNNTGTSITGATGVQLKDILPSGVTYVPGSCTNASTNNAPCSVVGNTITWDVATGSTTLAQGEGGTVSFDVTINNGVTGNITNTALINSAENDADPVNNTSSATTSVSAAATAPSITTGPAGATKCVGESVNFSVTASGTNPLNYQWYKGGIALANAISGATSNNFQIASVTPVDADDYYVKVSNSAGTVTSNAAILTVNTPPSISGQPQGATKFVGEAVTFSVTAAGTDLTYQWRKGGVEIANANSTSYSISSLATSDAGSYDVVVSGGCTPSATSTGAALIVNKKMPVISWSNPGAITYGTALGSTQLNATASYNNSPVEGNYTYSPLSGAVLNAGNNQTLSVTFTPTDANTYDTPVAKTAQINVLKKELTVTADNANRAYGADNPTNLTSQITGFVNNENSSVLNGTPALSIAATATATAAAGSTHAITAALGTLSATNYSFGFVNGTLTIDKASVQVSATGSMTYGSTPTLTPSYSGFVNGDTASVVNGTPVLSCPTCSGAAAGTVQTINVIDGNPALTATNYNFSFINASFTVGKAVLQVSATGSMTYGGSPTLTPSYTGFIAGEGVSVLNGTAPALSCSGCAGAPAGSTQTITVAAGNLAAANYSFNLVNGSFSVDKASLQITASSPTDIAYGAALPTITAAYVGFIPGDSASSLMPQPSCGTAYTVGSGVGAYATTCSGAASNNYTITYVPGSVTVIAKGLEIKASSPADISYGSAIPTVTPTYSGLVGTDTVTTAATCGTNYTIGSGVGAYTTSCSGAAASANYVINYVAGGFNVTKAAASVSAVANGKTYGAAEPALATTNNGFLAADLGAGKITFSASRAAGESFGTYAITAAASDNNSGMLGNYNVTYNPADFTITKKDATWTTNNNSKVYGAADPNPLTSGSGTGFLVADGVTATYSRIAGNGVGSYTITATLSAAVVGALGNYNITNNGASFEITRKALIITASSPANIAFNSAVPTITSSYDGFIVGDNIGNSLTTPPVCTTNYTVGSNVGAYTTSCADAASNNYEMSYVGGGFSVVKAGQSITFSALNSKYIGNGGTTVSATGGASNNAVTFASSTTSVCTSGGTNGATISFVGIGTCTIIASQAGNGNYEAATSVSQSFSVNPDPTTITLDNKISGVNFDCGTNTYTATVRDTITNAVLSGVPLKLTIGSQTATTTTNNDGVATFTLTLSQSPGSKSESVELNGSWSDPNRVAPALVSRSFLVVPSPNVGPVSNGASLYTGSLFFWTTSSTSSTATLTLSAAIKDTGICLNDPNVKGDITKATVSFQISTNGGTFSPVSSAQNLPVGLVNPDDTSIGTASAVSQYNIGNASSVTMTVRVVVAGQYNLNTASYDLPITIGKPGTASSLMGGGKVSNLSNDGNPFPANGFLGLDSIDSAFGSQVTYNKGGTNPQGQVQVYINSYNKPDGTKDTVLHRYFIKSNSISQLTMTNGSASFGSKTNVAELLPDGTKVSLDGGGTMQIVFTPNQKPVPRDMYTSNSTFVNANGLCINSQGCMSITAYKSTGGVWYSSSWGQGAGTTAPHTYVKPVLPGGNIIVQ